MTQSDDIREPAASSDPATSSGPADSTRRLRLSWGGATHHGRVRAANQDALFADRGLFVVADGMGGHRGGEVASQIAVRSMAGGRHETMDEFVESVSASNRAVWDHSEENPELKGMGTTLTAIAVLGDGRPPQLGVVNVGDSRIYRWRTGELEQLTDDHSYVAELIRRGQLSENEAATHPYRNMLTRAIGVAEDVDVDRWEIAPEAGDRFVLCSDGLVNELDDLEIRQAIGSIDDPVKLARTLIDRANVAGGRDNVTVVVVFVEVDEVEPPLPPPLVDETAPVSEPTGVLPSLDDAGTGDAVGPTDPVATDAVAAAGVAASTGVMAASLTDLPALGDQDTLDDVFGDGDSDRVELATDVPETDTPESDAPEAVVLDPTEPDVAAAASPFDEPADDDLPAVTARSDALSGYELPELDGDGPLPWLDADGPSDDAAAVIAEPASDDDGVDGPSDDEADDPAPLMVVGSDSDPERAAFDEVEEPVTEPSVERPAEPGGVFDDEAEVATDPNSTIVFADPGIVMHEPSTTAEEATGWRAPVAVTWAALAAVVVALVAVAGAVYAVGVYARGTYHVAFAGDEVVIYQGRSGGVLWFDPTLEEGSGIFRSQLPDATIADVASIVEVSSLEAARTYVDGIRPAVAEPVAEAPASDDPAPDDPGADDPANDAETSDATASVEPAGA